MGDAAIGLIGLGLAGWGAWGIYWARRDGLIDTEFGVADRYVEHGSFWAELIARWAFLLLGLGAVLKGLLALL